MNIRPLDGNILGRVSFDEHTTDSGIVISVNDNAKSAGIRARWTKVWKVGEGVTDVKAGDWVLVEHGRWSFKSEIVNDNGKKIEFMRIDPKALLAISEDRPIAVKDIEFD
jgi:co-chaperonin GroES (HSP10)